MENEGAWRNESGPHEMIDNNLDADNIFNDVVVDFGRKCAWIKTIAVVQLCFFTHNVFTFSSFKIFSVLLFMTGPVNPFQLHISNAVCATDLGQPGLPEDLQHEHEVWCYKSVLGSKAIFLGSPGRVREIHIRAMGSMLGTSTYGSMFKMLNTNSVILLLLVRGIL